MTDHQFLVTELHASVSKDSYFIPYYLTRTTSTVPLEMNIFPISVTYFITASSLLVIK